MISSAPPARYTKKPPGISSVIFFSISSAFIEQREKEQILQQRIEEYDKELEVVNQEQLRHMNVIEGLSMDYESIFYANLDENSIHPAVDKMPVILHPANIPVLRDDPVFHIVQIIMAVVDLVPDTLLHIAGVP